MSKFKKIFDSDDITDVSLTSIEGVAAIPLVASLARDEDIDEELLAETLWELELFAEYSEEELAELLDKIIAISSEDGTAALFNAAYDVLSDELALDGFAAAIIQLLEDGELSSQSREVLKALEVALELESDEAEEIIEAVLEQFTEEVEDEDEDENHGETWYDSPEGNFSLPLPVSTEKGGIIEEEEGCTKFSDNLGTLLRIDYFPFTAEMDDQMESVGEQTFLQGFLDSYISQAILANFSGSQVLHEESIKDVMEGCYFVMIDMPKGSTISQEDSQGNLTPLDAYRGLITFIYDGFLYVISNQRNFRSGETPLDLETEVADLQNKLLDFLETIEFIEA